MALQILFPNGQVLAVLTYIDDPIQGIIPWDGTIVATVSGAVTVTSGDITVDNAAGASAVNIQDGGNSITVDNAGTFAVQDAAAETTLAEIATDTDSLITAQGASSDNVTGPLVQTVSSIANPTYSNYTVEPLSTDQFGNLRVVTLSDVQASEWDNTADTAWNFVQTSMGFALDNQITIDNAWES